MEHAHEIRAATPFPADSACEYPSIFITKSGGMRVGGSFDVFCEGRPEYTWEKNVASFQWGRGSGSKRYLLSSPSLPRPARVRESENERVREWVQWRQSGHDGARRQGRMSGGKRGGDGTREGATRYERGGKRGVAKGRRR